MHWHKDLTPGLAASALFHAAALAALITGTPPPPTAARAAITVTLVVEPAGRIAPRSAEPVAAMSLEAAPAISPAPMLEPPAPQAAAVVAALSLPTIAMQKIKRYHRHPPSPSDTTATATLDQPASAAPAAAEVMGQPNGSPAASPNPGDGSMPSGGATATAAIAAASTSLPSADYLAAVMTWLDRHKEYPKEARSRRDQGTVLIAFVIDRGGHVLSFDIGHSSGSSMLDRAAEDMLRRADPLPAPPATYPGPRLRMVLPVTFALQ